MEVDMQGKRKKEKGKRNEGNRPALFPSSFFLLPLKIELWLAAKRVFASSFFLFPFAFCLVSGCRSCERVEAELRARENELRELRAELHRSEAINEGFARELQAIRPGAAASAKVSPELASQTYLLKEVVLGRQTGGVDDDDHSGDEALQVVLEPRDPDGHAIKAPGTLQVIALEVGGDGIKTPLCSWDIPAENLRRTWKSGLLSTGYYLVLPWKNWPTGNKLRVIARFTLADSRVFEADKDITIRPSKNHKPSTSPVSPLAPPTEGGDEELPLPTPRKVVPSQPSEAKTPTAPAKPGVQPASSWQASPASSPLGPPMPMVKWRN